VQAGTHVLWSQWFLAFLPAALLSIVIIWLSIRWLYPITNYELIVVQQSLSTGAQVVGPWSQQERKALLWLLLAIVLWALDFLHHLNPAMIAISIGLILVLPKVGVLDSTSIRQVNFTVVLFIGGALAMGRVLAETQVLDILVDSLVGWLAPIMSNAWQGAVILYWSNFFFRFLLGTELTTVSTALPLWLKAAETYGYNPACIGLIWAFAGAGKLFIYQSSVLVMGYAYGFFDSRDIFKIGAILTLFEGLVLMVLVPFYWPLVGLSWNLDSAEQRVTATQAEVVLSQTSAHHISEAGRPGYDMTSPMTSTSLNVDGLDAETTAWASIRDSSDSQDFVEFLNAFPQTRFVFAARMRLRQILRR
jgi:di/tricarboxylate transporter